MSFILVPVLRPKTLPAVCADMVKPCVASNITACFRRCDVFCEEEFTVKYFIGFVMKKSQGCY